MSEQTPSLFQGFALRPVFSEHQGVQCCHAMEMDSEKRYVIKTISLPPSQVQAEALLLSGAYPSAEALGNYYGELAKEVCREISFLDQMAGKRGFLPCEAHRLTPMDEGIGWQVRVLMPYRRSLARHLQKHSLTEREAVQLGIDLCAGLALCREAGWMYVSVKPENIFKADEDWCIGDLGFVDLDTLHYASLPDRYRSVYTAPEVRDAFAKVGTTMDVYALGMTLYQIFHGGKLPFAEGAREAWLSELASGQAISGPRYAEGELAAIILKAIAFDPARRFQTPQELARELIDYMNGHALGDTPLVALQPEPPVEELPLKEEPPVPSEEDVPMQETIVPQEQEEAEAAADPPELPEEPEEQEEPAPEPPTVEISEPQPEPEPKPEVYPAPRKPRRKFPTRLLLLLLAAAIGTALWSGYQHYFVLTVDALTCQGSGRDLTVIVESQVEDSELQVHCRDNFGNALTGTLIHGTVTFRNLEPGTQYIITLEPQKLRTLRGQTTAAYTIPSGIRITHLSAVTGQESGSAIISFGVEGIDSDRWTLTCEAQGENIRTFVFQGHTTTIYGLTVGTEYTFRLFGPEELPMEGFTTMTYTAGKLIYAKNLAVSKYEKGVLTVTWSGDADRWLVHCGDGMGYDSLIECAEKTAVFENVTPGSTYTIEVTAIGQTMGKRIQFAPKPQ